MQTNPRARPILSDRPLDESASPHCGAEDVFAERLPTLVRALLALSCACPPKITPSPWWTPRRPYGRAVAMRLVGAEGG